MATAAAVETVAYTALALASLTLYPVTDTPYTFFTELLESSAFTIIWGLADAVVYNLSFINVMTHESFARYWAEKVNPTPILLCRVSDDIYISEWQAQHQHGAVNDPMLRGIVAAGEGTQEMIGQGARFIVQDVLSGASAKTIEDFKVVDPGVLIFVLTKAIYIYAAGEKKNAPIPHFFKQETQDRIAALRFELKDEQILNQLKSLTTDPAEFEREPQEESIKIAFRKLKEAASGELQNSVFTLRCCQEATQLLRS